MHTPERRAETTYRELIARCPCGDSLVFVDDNPPVVFCRACDERDRHKGGLTA